VRRQDSQRADRVKPGGRLWARPESGFTLLFEALVITILRVKPEGMGYLSAMPVKAVARIVGEHDTRRWRVVHHYVDQARARAGASGVTRLAIPRVKPVGRLRSLRGHDYVTLFVDIDRARVVFATVGKSLPPSLTRGMPTIAAFTDDLAAHGGSPDAISEVCIDMSPAFIKGIAENLPNADITCPRIKSEGRLSVPCRQDHQ
jgi:transposase